MKNKRHEFIKKRPTPDTYFVIRLQKFKPRLYFQKFDKDGRDVYVTNKKRAKQFDTMRSAITYKFEKNLGGTYISIVIPEKKNEHVVFVS